MNTENKTKRERAYKWWSDLKEPLNEAYGKIYFPSHEWSHLTLDKVERIYLSEHPEEDLAALKEKTISGLNELSKLNAEIGNFGAPPAKHQSSSVIEGLEDANRYFNKKRQSFTGVNAGDYLDEEDFISYANAAHGINMRLQEQNSNLLELCGELVNVLDRIAKWDLPSTGQYWDKEETKPMSYGAAYGSNGERDFIKSVAKNAINKANQLLNK